MNPTSAKQELNAAFRFVDYLIYLLKKYDRGYGSKQHVNKANGHTYTHIYKLLRQGCKGRGPYFATIFNILQHHSAWNEKQILADFEKFLKAQYKVWEREKKVRGVRRRKKRG